MENKTQSHHVNEPPLSCAESQSMTSCFSPDTYPASCACTIHVLSLLRADRVPDTTTAGSGCISDHLLQASISIGASSLSLRTWRRCSALQLQMV